VVGPTSAAGLTLAARPPHAGPPGQAPMSDRRQATPILLTQLLTTNLDERGRGWNCHVTIERASGPYGQRRPHLDEPDLATDQKVGGSSPSERAQVNGPFPHRTGAFLVPLGATLGAMRLDEPPDRARVINSAAARLSPSSRWP